MSYYLHAQPLNRAKSTGYVSEPSVRPYTLCERTAALARLCRCAGSPEHSLFAYVISDKWPFLVDLLIS